MRNQGQILIGAVVILVGLVFLLGGLLHVDIGTLCWPTVLILLGVWILVRPYMIGRDTAFRAALFGPVRRDGAWQVTAQEIWLFVGDVRLNFTQAEIPTGETSVRIFGFVADVRLVVPDGVGVSVSSTAFVSEVKVLGQKRESFLIPAHMTTENYDACERRIRLETMCFVSDVKVQRPV